MKSWKAWCAGASALLLATLAAAQNTPVRIQYDQLREYLNPGAAPPHPEAFAQEYAKLASQPPPQPVSAGAQRAEITSSALATAAESEIEQRFALMALGIAGMGLGGSPLSHVPVLGKQIGGRVLAKGSIEANEKLMRAQNAQMQRQGVALDQRIMMQSLNSQPSVQRVSIWDGWVRIDNPADHTAIIYKPDQNAYIAIDDTRKQYRVLHGAGAPQPPPNMACNMAVTVNDLGTRQIDGQTAHGFRIDSQMQGVPMTSTSTMYFLDQPLPAQTLELATQYAPCPAGSAWSQLPVDKLPLYQVSATHADASSPMAGFGVTSVLMRGNVHALNDADGALFEPPAGYQQVQ